MEMTLSQMLDLYRQRSGQRDNFILTDNEVVDDLNAAIDDINIMTQNRFMPSRYSWASVANQDLYALPGNFGDIIRLYRNLEVPMKERSEYFLLDDAVYQAGTPIEFAIWGNYLRLIFKENESAKTATLGANISASATSLWFTDANDQFLDQGTILINSEKIRYHHKSVSGSTITLTFLAANRGVERTLAAAHTAGATITQQNLEMLYWAKAVPFIYGPDQQAGQIGDPAADGAIESGTRKYYWTFYDSTNNIESSPRDMGEHTFTVDQKITLSDLVDAPYGLGYSKKIYRSLANTTAPLYLLTTLNDGTTSYIDNISDAALAAGTGGTWSRSNAKTNLPEETHEPLVDLAVAKRFAVMKRYDEADRLAFQSIQKIKARADHYWMSREPATSRQAIRW
jgi:hypothetical protein